MNGYKYNKHLYNIERMNYYEYRKQLLEIIRWCENTFGKDTNRWGYYNNNGFNFNDEKDYALFLLRWA